MEIVLCVSCGNEIFSNENEDTMCGKCEEVERLRKENKELKEELIQSYHDREKMFMGGEREWIQNRIKELEC